MPLDDKMRDARYLLRCATTDGLTLTLDGISLEDAKEMLGIQHLLIMSLEATIELEEVLRASERERGAVAKSTLAEACTRVFQRRQAFDRALARFDRLHPQVQA